MNRRDLLKASMSFGSVSLLAAGTALTVSAPSRALAADGHAHTYPEITAQNLLDVGYPSRDGRVDRLGRCARSATPAC